MNKIEIKRGNLAVMQLPLDDKAVYSAQVMGEEYIETSLSMQETLQLQIGDRLLHHGVEFVLFDEPDHSHQDGVHTYPIRFHAPYYVFGFVKHKHQRAIDISYCGTLEEHIAMLFSDVQQAGTGSGATASCYTGFRVEWGTVDKTAVQNIEFGDGTCLEALAKICETYGLEYRFSGKSLFLAPAEQQVDPDAAYPAFEYGKGKGLYSLERQGISNESVATRLYVLGSDRNLPPDYRKNDNPRPVRLTIAGRYLDANTAKYGVREQTVTNDEIFPCLKDVQVVGTPAIAEKTCTFRIRFAKAADVFELTDNVIKDREPKVSFTTGALTGEEFSILKGGWRAIDSTTREIEIIRSEIEYGGTTHYLPSDERLPAEGDEFVLFDLNMPAQYVTRAEAELREWGFKQLEKKSVRQYGYKLEIDPRYIKRQGTSLHAGDRIRITDEGVSRIIRISRISYPLVRPAQLSVELSDIKVGTFAEKVETQIKDVTGAVQEVHRQTGAISRRAWRDAQEIAEMVEALSAPGLLTGDAEGQFTCSSVIRCNVDGNPNKIVITDGELKHALHAPATGAQWEITGGETILDEAGFPLDKPFWLYAVCSLANNSAYIAAATEMPTEEEPAHRFFRIGVLSSAFNVAEKGETPVHRRTFNYTNRYSQIVGGNITTSVISDPARRLVIDLDSARITASDGAQISGRIDLTDSTIDGKTVIEGGRIRAESIDTDNLTVKQLQTSNEADRRIVVSKKDHNITMYNENDQLRLEIAGETKNRFTDIVDTGGATSKTVSMKSFSESAEAILPLNSQKNKDLALNNGSLVAYEPFTISGSVKPSLTLEAIQPNIWFYDDLLKGDYANARVNFSVVIEKQDDTGAWKTYEHLGTMQQSYPEEKEPIPAFYRGATIHNIKPGTYRIVYYYSIFCKIIRLGQGGQIIEGGELKPGGGFIDSSKHTEDDNFIQIKPGAESLKAFVPITANMDTLQTGTAPLENDSLQADGPDERVVSDLTTPFLPEDDIRVAPVNPFDPPVGPIVPVDPPIGPVDPPIRPVTSTLTASVFVHTTKIHFEYSILRTSIFANGMASVWAEDKYFRILDGSEPNLIETRGTMQILSQTGNSGLRITNDGVLASYKGASWGGLMPPVEYIGHVHSDGTLISQWRAPGKLPLVSVRLNKGIYKINFNPAYFSASDYILLYSSFYGYGRFQTRQAGYCELFLADDDTANDAEFYFIVLNVRNYLS